MHFIINGEDQGVRGKDIPYKAGPLRAVVDVYGITKQVQIVQLYGGKYLYPRLSFVSLSMVFRLFLYVSAISMLQSACQDAILQYIKRNAVSLLPLPRLLKDYLLHQLQ